MSNPHEKTRGEPRANKKKRTICSASIQHPPQPQPQPQP